MTDYYRDIAVDYDWLHDDDALAHGFAITRTDFGQTADQYVVTAVAA